MGAGNRVGCDRWTGGMKAMQRGKGKTGRKDDMNLKKNGKMEACFSGAGQKVLS